MAEATYSDKARLCYTDVSDYTDIQGIGSDPLYKRYDGVNSVVANLGLPERCRSFLAQPHYDGGRIAWYVPQWRDQPPVCLLDLTGKERARYEKIKADTLGQYRNAANLSRLKTNDERLIISGALKYIDDHLIYCYDDRVVLVAWGMRFDASRHQLNGSWVKDLVKSERFKVTFDAGEHGHLKDGYRGEVNVPRARALTAADIPEVVTDEGFTFAGWQPALTEGYKVLAPVTFVAQYADAPKGGPFNVTFVCQPNGSLTGTTTLTCEAGHVLTPAEIPVVTAAEGYKFGSWEPAIFTPITADTVFTATIETDVAKCRFSAGEHGDLEGQAEWTKPVGASFLATEVPKVKARRGFRFVGWNVPPLQALAGDTTFVAQYEAKTPWYSKRWVRWTLGSLLSLALMTLLSLLLRSCLGCSPLRHRTPGEDIFGKPVLPVDSIGQLGQVKGRDGKMYDNNGEPQDIGGRDGTLPKLGVTAPIVGKQGQQPPLIHNEGAPDVVANRLNIYFDNSGADLQQWAHAFKKAYPDDDYKIIGYDPNVPLIQIMIPADKRDQVRKEINQKIPGQQFFVVDESVITLRQTDNAYAAQPTNGWHLTATHVQQAWAITKGSPSVVVAVVDDGVDASHQMLQGRFYKAYNVFTQNRLLSRGSGHGTHVAALAAGSADHVAEGAAGVAPQCRVMPVQVFDNGLCTFSSVISGIMYAVNNGASVINVSIGPSFQGLDQLPLEQQQQVVSTLFTNEERVYRHVIAEANKKNATLVFAAGNDNIITAIAPECREANNTINVTACGPNLLATQFTNYAVGSSITAPGQGIYSAFTGNTYRALDGTSMAAPIVSGAVALMKSLRPSLTVQQIISILQATGQPLEPAVPPMLLIDRALQMVQTGQIPAPAAGSITIGLPSGDGQGDGIVINPGQAPGFVVGGDGDVVITDKGGNRVSVPADGFATPGDETGNLADGRGRSGNGPGNGLGDRTNPANGSGLPSGPGNGRGDRNNPANGGLPPSQGGGRGNQPGNPNNPAGGRNNPAKPNGQSDDYASVRQLITQLKAQRDAINRRINDLERQVK